MRKHETRSNSKSYLSVIIHILTTKYILPFPYQTLRVCVQKCCEYAPIQGVSATPVCSKQLLFPFHHSFQRYQKNITYIVAGREEADRGGRGGGEEEGWRREGAQQHGIWRFVQLSCLYYFLTYCCDFIILHPDSGVAGSCCLHIEPFASFNKRIFQ